MSKTPYELPLSFYALPLESETTVDTKQLRELLLDTGGKVFIRGRFLTIKKEHLGVGVYKITLVERIPKR